jgi:hypothetical protein
MNARIPMVAAGVVGVGAGVAASVAAERTARHDPKSASRIAVGSVVATGGALATAFVPRARNVFRPLGAGLAAAGGTALLGSLASGQYCNTVDDGLNAVEVSDFRSDYWKSVGRGIVGGAGLAGLLMALPRTPLRARIAIPTLAAPKVALAAAGAATAGAFVGGVIAAGGQAVRSPSTRDVAQVAETMFEQAAGSAAALELGVREVPDEDEDGEPVRQTLNAAEAKFYFDADADGDGQVTATEVGAHVASFDVNGDGSFDDTEWTGLHESVVAV